LADTGRFFAWDGTRFDYQLSFTASTVEFEGSRFFFLRDPDGNVLEFHRPAAAG
jgi:catechol 2,3-dioxygenase-like lactoylglutathione lyase family enzyme